MLLCVALRCHHNWQRGPFRFVLPDRRSNRCGCFGRGLHNITSSTTPPCFTALFLVSPTITITTTTTATFVIKRISKSHEERRTMVCLETVSTPKSGDDTSSSKNSKNASFSTTDSTINTNVAKEQNKRRQGQKRRVRFSRQLHTIVGLVPRRSDFSDTERRSVWFDQHDYLQSRTAAFRLCQVSECASMGKLLETGYRMDQASLDIWSSSSSLRGLEGWTSELHGKTRRMCRLINAQGLVETQKRLRSKQLDTEMIAKHLYNSSLAHTAASRSFARRVGLADRRAVLQDIHQNTNRMTPDPSTQHRVDDSLRHQQATHDPWKVPVSSPSSVMIAPQPTESDLIYI